MLGDGIGYFSVQGEEPVEGGEVGLGAGNDDVSVGAVTVKDRTP